MTSMNFPELTLYFTFYSMLGWVCESVWGTIRAKRLTNRGFLAGPWCPVYGFGALLVILTAQRLHNVFLTFICAMAVAAALDYAAGRLLESLFQARLWNYSHLRFSIKGRIYLVCTLVFGLFGTAAAHLIQPAAANAIHMFGPELRRVLSCMLIVFLIFDLLRTLITVTNLRERVAGLKAVFDGLAQDRDAYIWFNKSDLYGSVVRLRALCAGPNATDLQPLLHRIESAVRRGGETRMLKAFPHLRFLDMGLGGEYDALRRAWFAELGAAKKRDLDIRGFINRFGLEVAAAYKSITFAHVVWIFFIGSIAGFVAETLWFYFRAGVIESRQGMLYGPFSQIYGFGAILMVLLLMPLAKLRKTWVFLGSALVGCLFEVVCGLVQEILFGSVSWRYAPYRLTLFGGRASVHFMIFWGIMGMLYICYVNPAIISFIDRLPKRPKWFFTWVIIIVLTVNMLLSAAVVNRWSKRLQDNAPVNRFEELIDRFYHDNMLEEIYPNMRF